MIFASSKLLGLALADRSIACAELTVRGDRPTVRKTATFTLPEHLSLEKPDALGQALASFLRTSGFSASRAVVGVPAKWVIAVEKEIPPASDEQARAMLRLAAERLSVAESGELAFDYAGRQQSGQPAKVLLVAMLRKQLQRVERAIEAAGLSIVAVTPTSLALATAADHGDQDLPMLMLARHGAEIVWQQQGTPRMLRHVLAPNGDGVVPEGALGSELRRAIAMAPTTGGWLLWDECGLSETQVAELSDRLGVRIRRGAMQAAPQQFASPVALALAGADRTLLPMDFSHSRLAPRPKTRLGRAGAWAVAVGAAVLIAIVSLYLDVRNRSSTLDQLQAQLRDMAGEVKSAQSTVDRVKFAAGYFPAARPAMLECLREITQAFRDDEQIWATSFTLRDNHKGQLMGKANEWKTVLDVADRLRKNPAFSEVKVLDVSESGGRSRERSFSISFNFDFGQ